MSVLIRLACLIGLLLHAGSALAVWEQAYDTDDWALCVVADPVHQVVYTGTYSGFAYLDVASGQWTQVLGQPGADTVVDIAWHPAQAGRLLLARGIIDTAGRIDLTLDFGATVSTVLALPEDVYVGDLERDPSDPTRFYAVAYGFGSAIWGAVYRSSDSGLSWEMVEQSATSDRYCLAVDRGGHVYIAGADGVRRSLDGGETWEAAQGDMPVVDVNCLRAQPGGTPGHLFAATDHFLYETLDGGEHWNPILWADSVTDLAIHPTVPSIMAVHILVWAGPVDHVLISDNGGLTWSYTNYWQIMGDWGAYQSMDILPTLNRIYATMEDWIFTYDLGATAVASAPAAGLRLAAWPNPFNPSTQIRLVAPAAPAISLHILDSAGRLQRTLLNRVPHAGGELRVAWDGCDEAGRRLPSGVYHYLLEAGGEQESGKLTLLK